MPSDSSPSLVAGTSRSDFTPADTTSAGVRASCARSAETSGGFGKPRWTPPSPPVAMKRSPAARATASVPPTVVAPIARWATATARSRGPTLRASGPNCSSSARVRPTTISPSSSPIVAGTAPASRTCRSDSSPTWRPSPGGKPCATRVVSSTTTARASRTSSVMRITGGAYGLSGLIRPRRRCATPAHALVTITSSRALHLDEAALLPFVLGDLAETRAPIRAECALVPGGDPQPERLRMPLLARVLEPGADERLCEPAAGQIGTDAEADPDLAALLDEVEEADEVALVAYHRAQAVAPRRVREELDPPGIGRGVVPLVRELVAPFRNRGGVLLGH